MKKSGLVVSKVTLLDPRRFQYEKKFGAPILHNEDTFLPESKVKDQLDSDECVAFSLSAHLEGTEGVEISPDFIFAKGKQKNGTWEDYGLDPKYAAEAVVGIGAVEQSAAPLSLEKDGRDKVANWNNWPKTLDEAAKIHKQKSYFWVNGFNGIRSVLQAQKKSVQVGVYWQEEWTNVVGGIIPEYSYFQLLSHEAPHAILVTNQRNKVVNFKNQLYLRIQNSYNESRGDGGFYYFPKSQADKFIFGLVCLDDDPETTKQETWGILARMYNALLKILQSLSAQKEPTQIDVEPPPPVVPEPISPPVQLEPTPPHFSRIMSWAKAIQAHETNEGKDSFLLSLNNPCGLRCSPGFKSQIGCHAGNYAVFRTYEDGLMTACHVLENAASGRSHVYSPEMTLYEFYAKYAPDSDNNLKDPKLASSRQYAERIATVLDISPNTKIKELL